jgi:tetratricopeptide (TPR) repeat protein
MKYGDALFDKGKVDEAMMFYKKAKVKGQKFDNDKILNYLYQKKEYKTVYKLQNYLEGDYKMHIQGSVFDKMIELGENLDFIKKFMADVNIYGNKQDEAIVSAYANNKMFDKMIMRLFTTKRKLFSSFTPAQMGVKKINLLPFGSGSTN